MALGGLKKITPAVTPRHLAHSKPVHRTAAGKGQVMTSNDRTIQGASPDYARAHRVLVNEIPVIDLSGINDPAQRKDIGRQLVAAATQIGFFYVSGHGIASSLCSLAMQASRDFFTMPQQVKAGITVDQHQRGWMAQGLTNLEGAATHDAKEVFFWGRDVDADDPDVVAGLPLVHPNQWPDAKAPFLREAISPYYQAVMALGVKILECLALGPDGDPKIFTSAYDKPLGRGQLVYYPVLERADVEAERFGAAAHTDFGVLTALLQDNLGGLQVLNSAGTWIEVAPIADTFVCNIGDLLELWTNGQLISTRHRVINRSPEARFSIPIFCDPASETIVNPRDFDRNADTEALPAVVAGAYIMGKNRANFSHYSKQDS